MATNFTGTDYFESSLGDLPNTTQNPVYAFGYSTIIHGSLSSGDPSGAGGYQDSIAIDAARNTGGGDPNHPRGLVAGQTYLIRVVVHNFAHVDVKVEADTVQLQSWSYNNGTTQEIDYNLAVNSSNGFFNVALNGYGNNGGSATYEVYIGPLAPADTTPPHLISVTPADDSTNVAVGSNLTLTFDEAVKGFPGSIEIHKADGTLVANIPTLDTNQVTFSGSTVTVNPTADLVPGTNYYIVVTAGSITDTAGNSYAGLTSPTAFNFTTAGGGLFTSGADTVNFTQLAVDKVAAINAMSAPYAGLYNALGGSDTVTLPNIDQATGKYLLVSSPGAAAVNSNVIWDPTQTFTIGATSDASVNTDNITGGNGNYKIHMLGPATINIGITGDGSSTIIDGGTGADTISLQGAGNNVIHFEGLVPSLGGSIVDKGSLTLNATDPGVISGTFSGALSGTGSLTTQGGFVVMSGTASQFSGNTTIASGTLDLKNGITLGTGSIIFGDANETLEIDSTTMPLNSIKSLQVGDTIDLAGVSFASGAGAFLDITKSSSTPVLDVFVNNQIYTLQIGDSASRFASQGLAFHLASDGKGGTQITLEKGLSFDNTFDTTVTSQYKNSILAAEAELARQWINPTTINLKFVAQNETSNDLATNRPIYTENSNGSLKIFDYTTELVPALQRLASKELSNTYLQAAVNSLPSVDPSAGAGFLLPVAYARLLSLPTQSTSIDDTIFLNTAFNFNYGVDVLNALLHEITEGMGRLGNLGDQNSSAFMMMDLFRYSDSGVLDTGAGRDGRNGLTSYFSYNGGKTNTSINGGMLPSGQVLSYNNEFQGSSTKSNTEDPGDFTQSDIFGPTRNATTLSQTDIQVMDALGWLQDPNSAIAPIVSAGQTLNVAAGQTQSGTQVAAGGVVNVSGTVNDAIVFGTLNVLAGGSTDPTQIYTGGLQVISSGGTDVGAFVLGGEQDVYGSASGVTISSGKQVVESGGTATGSTILTGGTVTVLPGGTIKGTTTINGGTLVLNAGALAQTVSFGSNGGTLNAAGFTTALSVTGGSREDTITLGSGNDTATGGSGNDIIDGGPGNDTAVYAAAASSYTVFSYNGVVYVLTGGADGKDQLRNVENLKFADKTILASTAMAFDPWEYLASNADLIKSIGPNPQAGFDHYINSGFIEGRATNSFNALEYLASNTDLIASIGFNLSGAAQHYVTNGFNEHRATASFDPLLYLDSNTDLIQAFGLNPTAAEQHYVSSGFNEHRPTASFDPYEYVASNSDLIKSIGLNSVAAETHYITNGFKEHRATNSFDAAGYLASNTDLLKALGSNLLAAEQHYITTGFNEHRATNSFDAAEYLASNTDLLQTLGPNLAAAELQYVQAGFSQKRPTNSFDATEYLASNTDLITAIGYNLQAAEQHYVTIGFNEHRATTSFNALEYLASNPDLLQNLGPNLAAAEQQYVQTGFNDHRATTSFDPYEYVASNTDLIAPIGLNAAAAEQHYINAGFTEHRATNSFDAAEYLASNTDLITAFGFNLTAARQHYITTGLHEHRATSSFDAAEYLASNTDLLQTLGPNLAAAEQQYVQTGFNVHRPTNSFDALEYLASNTDLIQAFGSNLAAAEQHYISSGFNEHRATAAFDPLEYLASNPDLIKAFGLNTLAAEQHYVTNGFSEGRATTSFDSLEYLASNPDLIHAFGLDPATAYQHWLHTGYNEGRATASFDAAQYLANNPDLTAAFGANNYVAARQHYITNGLGEGRTDQAPVINGDGGDNTLVAKAGAIMTGGGGLDAFVFNSALQKSATITDFTAGSDHLDISAAGFGHGLISGGNPTLVTAADFASATSGTNGYFIFDNAGANASTLYWDANGGSGADAIALVKLTGIAALHTTDFLLV